LANSEACRGRFGSDNEPELRAQAFVDWCALHRITMCFIQPGEPQQNAFVERFNRTYRHEVLNAYVFDTLDVREVLCPTSII
jgi:putative transposase